MQQAVSIELLLQVALSTVGIFFAVITYTRIAGLRSFSKMSSFDFAMTIAIGSLMASVAVVQVSFIEGLLAVGVLYITQVCIAFVRRRDVFRKLIDNQPILLLKNGKFLHENMKKSRITKADILFKLRESNVSKIEDVQAVIFETSGDISVLYGGHSIDTELLEGVRRD